ncbi:hypothetical protein M9435_005116 [Picochlorum sp. BPE23]|nr:hypothetical protein M9435_005116 [Picochlorum sp. BPE23]|eukprot:jgi/Picre1/35209/NNA_002671.t1
MIACKAVSTQARAVPVVASINRVAGSSRLPMAVVRRQTVRASAGENELDTDAIISDLSEKWEAVENKPAVVIYTVGAISGVWLANTVVGAINSLPLLPKVFELVGLGYAAWFTYRYLLFKDNREELLDDIEALKKKIAGDA